MGIPSSHPVPAVVHTELLDGWSENPKEVFWWLLATSHPITGVHPQPGCAKAQRNSQTTVCLRSQRTPFLSLRPPTTLHAHCSNVMVTALQQSVHSQLWAQGSTVILGA